MHVTRRASALYKKSLSRLQLLKGLRSFGVNRTLLRTFYNTVVASAIFYRVVCLSSGMAERDRRKLSKPMKRANSVLDCSLDPIGQMDEERM